MEEQKFRTVTGGLKVEIMDKLLVYECVVDLLQNKFVVPETEQSKMETMQQIKQLIENEPLTIVEYIRKFKRINEFQLVQEVLYFSRYRTELIGLHLVEVKRVGNGENQRQHFSYQVTLNQEFIDKFRSKQPGGVTVQLASDDLGTKFNSIWFDFNRETGMLKFTLDKQLSLDTDYIIRFVPIRFLFNAKYHVLKNAVLMEEKLSFLVFPQTNFIDDRKSDYIAHRDAFIRSIHGTTKLNAEQQAAVFAIVTGLEYRVEDSSGILLPHIIRGPPGTGKTEVIASAINMLVRDSDVRILLILPTNDAADDFSSELIDKQCVGMDSMFRLNSLTSDPDLVRDKRILNISFTMKKADNKLCYGIPEIETLLEKKIIISTIGASTYLVIGQLSGFFTHIIADEAGQASELDMIVPIVGLTGRNTKIIISGDTAQLGHVEIVNHFRKRNLTISMLERFEKIPLYKEDPRLMTFLCKNYRSHKAIVGISSQLFYDNKLVVAENANKWDSLCKWDLLPNKQFPILWHHLEAQEIRESNGSSYANPVEVNLICDYAVQIIMHLGVKPEEISIITPYSYQLVKIKQALQKKRLNCHYSTIERFQGGDNRVVIVSCVRSNPREKIGFLNSHKRFNTLISRARELILVVGNSKVMMSDNSWAYLVNSCRKQRSMIGISVEDLAQYFPQDSNEANEHAEQIEALTFQSNIEGNMVNQAESTIVKDRIRNVGECGDGKENDEDKENVEQ